MKKLRCWVGAALVFGVCSRPLHAQTLENVPGKTLVVIKVKNLQATSGKIAKFANDLGIAAMVPQMNDPLKALEDKLKISQGINAGGDLYISFLDPTGSGEKSDKSMIVLVPVTDYKAFLTNFPDAQTDGDVSQVKMADAPDPGYIASWGTYAALTPSKELVATKPTESLKVTAAGDKELAGKDITVYANFTALRTVLQPKLAEHRDEFLKDMEKGAAKSPQGAKMGPMVHAIGNQMLNAADGFLRDATAATYSINIGDEGITYSAMAEFTQGSYIGNTVQAMKTSADPMLTGLPGGKYLFFGGFVADPATSSKLVSDLVDPMVKEIAASGPDSQSLTDYAAQIKILANSIKGGSLGVYAPTGALGQEGLLQEGAILNGDANAILASQQKVATLTPDAMKAFGLPQDMYKIAYTPKAKTVNGVTFDSVVTTVTPDPNNAASQQQAQMLALMYGPAGATQLTGVQGDHLITGFGLNDAQLSTLIDVAKTNDAPLATLEPVKKVATQLPGKHVAEMFVPLDQVVTTGLSYAKQFGFAVPVQLPPDLPPIGAALSTDAASMRFDAYVPTALVQSLVAAGMQAAMQMNGGGGGGM